MVGRLRRSGAGRHPAVHAAPRTACFYARPALDKQWLGQLTDLIGNISFISPSPASAGEGRGEGRRARDVLAQSTSTSSRSLRAPRSPGRPLEKPPMDRERNLALLDLREPVRRTMQCSPTRPDPLLRKCCSKERRH
ncbi:MAG: hypothetical protein ACT4NU_01775 [Chromatiales bacterium]